MGPSISLVPALVCLSPPGSTLFCAWLCKGAVAGLASSIRVYSSHLAASGLRAIIHSICLSSLWTRSALPSYPCATWQPTRVAGARVCMRGDGTMSSSMPACMLEAGAPLQGQPPLEDLPRVMWSTKGLCEPSCPARALPFLHLSLVGITICIQSPAGLSQDLEL